MDRCEVARCRAGTELTYLGKGVCSKHWNELTADDAAPDALRVALGLPATPGAAMEEAMDDGSKKKAEAAEKTQVKTKKTKAAKEPKPAKERKARQPEQFDGKVVVFAFRLGANDRDRIHAAAGPAGATRFVRSAALAASSGDRDAFDALVAQAKANTK